MYCWGCGSHFLILPMSFIFINQIITLMHPENCIRILNSRTWYNFNNGVDESMFTA